MQGFVYALLIEVTLSYMKLNDPNSARLGTLLLEGRIEWFNGASSALVIAPLVVLLLIVAAFTLVERGMLGRWARR